uniref:Uncharacterized protein n=1 Tax=Anguilla anguilla TaxID=7936 RepID=A0A0E9WHA0_ANGAN
MRAGGGSSWLTSQFYCPFLNGFLNPWNEQKKKQCFSLYNRDMIPSHN